MFHAIEHGWTTSDHLLAHVIDGLRINNWQRTEGATKHPPRNVPEPFPRPGDDNQQTTPERGDAVSVGGAIATVTTVGEFMAAREQRERQWRAKHNKPESEG